MMRNKPAYRLAIQFRLFHEGKFTDSKSISFYNFEPSDLEKLETVLIEAFEKVKI